MKDRYSACLRMSSRKIGTVRIEAIITTCPDFFGVI